MNKKIITIVMCLIVCLMITGYAVLGQNLKINGTADIESNWNIIFTNVSIIERTTGVTITSTPTISGTTLNFGLNLKAPGDSVKLSVTVENKGTIDAIINNIEAKKGANEAIKIEITGIKKGDKLAKGKTNVFEISIMFDPNVTNQPIMDNDMLTVSAEFVQDVGQAIEGSDIIIEKPILLINQILKDNISQPDTNIDFSRISSDTNGKGLYYTSTNTEDNKVTYYFRGNVTNNYVSFANNIWRIIRINEDNSIRLIKQTSIGIGVFNTNYNDATYVGYMYGTASSATYQETHANINSSTIKEKIDTWYRNNLINYSSHLADSGFCGDRSLSSGTGIGTPTTYYGANNRLRINKIPQFKCPQANDLYTTKISSKDNKALDYPIGLITADEVAYAGGVHSIINEEYYLTTKEHDWTMSPFRSDSNAYVWGVNINVGVDILNVNLSRGVRPVINLKSTIEITSGNGTLSNPYVIKTN